MSKKWCPNCGSELPFVDGTCISCWWHEGEPFFRPHWMDDKTWSQGMACQWLPPKKKGGEDNNGARDILN